MNSKLLIPVIFTALCFVNCKEQEKKVSQDIIIGKGQMPSVAKDSRNNLYVVYGSSDSIMYSTSIDQGKTFSSPTLIAVLPDLSAGSMRGPQITSTSDGVIVIASNGPGDIFSYREDKSGNWSKPSKVNDVDTVAKEGFMALSADGQNAFAAWLDLRHDRYNKIVGAKSSDGGKTWSKNIIIYKSPDTTVCQCCKPSVAVNGENVYVMFRNKLKGNRDLHLIQSSDGGGTFGEAKKIGNGSWALDGCPMDGGGLVINNSGKPETVWRRKSVIYTCEPGQQEVAIGEGRGCTIESANGKNVYAWTQNGNVVILNPQHEKIILGKGSLPALKYLDNGSIFCIWENDNQIHSSIVSM